MASTTALAKAYLCRQYYEDEIDQKRQGKHHHPGLQQEYG